MTVSLWTPVSRAVLRVPVPSATWASTATTLPAGNRASNRGVPLRSEKRLLQVEQRRTRVWFWGENVLLAFAKPAGKEGRSERGRRRLLPKVAHGATSGCGARINRRERCLAVERR